MDNLIILDSERRYFPTSNEFLRKSYEFLEDKYLNCIYKIFILPKVKKYVKDGNCKIIAADQETEIILRKNKIHFTRFDLYNKYSLKDDCEIIKFINDLPVKIPEIDVKYNNISLWSMNRGDVIYLHFFKPILNRIKTIENIIALENPVTIIIFNASSRLGLVQKKFYVKIKVIDRTDILSKLKRRVFQFCLPMAVKTIRQDFFKKIKKSRYRPQKSREILFFECDRALEWSLSFLKRFDQKTIILQNKKSDLDNEHFSFDLFENYLNSNSKAKLLTFGQKLVPLLGRLKVSNNFKNKFVYRGIDLKDIFVDLIEFLFRSGYLNNAYYIECLNNFFKHHKPKLNLITCELPELQKISIALAKNYNIKTLFVTHGTIGKTYLYDNLKSNKIAVYGKYYQNVLQRFNNKKSKIVITGNPAWDKLTKFDFRNNRKKLMPQLKINQTQKIILLATSNDFNYRDELIHSVIKIMPKLYEYQLVIKLHPEEKPEFYKKVLNKYGIKVPIVTDRKLLHPLIAASELVIISNSTVGLETLILNKPLIDVNLSGEPFWNDYVEKKVALGVRKGDELLPAIRSILENSTLRKNMGKRRKKYVFDHAYKQDGKATERVVKLINKMLGGTD